MGPSLARYGPVSGLLIISAAAMAAPGEERLVSPPLNGFVEIATENTPTQSGRQEVLRGETATQWSRMITTVRFRGMGNRMASNQFIQATLRDLRRNCRRAIISSVATRNLAGYQTSMVHVDCPPALAQEPESFVRLAISGGDDMHLKEITFRGGRTAMELAWARSFLSGVVLCLPRDRQPACQR